MTPFAPNPKAFSTAGLVNGFDGTKGINDAQPATCFLSVFQVLFTVLWREEGGLLFTQRSLQAPWYNSNTAHQGEVDDMRDDLEPILYEHGVDIVFAGKQ